MVRTRSNRRPPSPTPTYVSMKSDKSMGRPIKFTGGDSSTGRMVRTRSNRRPPSPTPTYVSMKSDKSMGRPIKFTGGDSSTGRSENKKKRKRSPSPTTSFVSKKRSKGRPKGRDSSTEQFQQIHKSHLQKKFQCLIEGIQQQGETKLLHEIYTDLYIIEWGRGEVNDEHEIKQIEMAFRSEATQGRPIKCNDIFKPLPRQVKPRTVLTKGVAGIGKTVSVQKFILDWAEGTVNQDVHFIFPLPFRELNLMKEKKLSLVDLIQYFSPEMKDPRIFTSSEHRVMFIFDGLDEFQLPLDFNSNTKCCNVTEPASVDVLLTNLIKGNLLPSALLWITTRPAAANQIPPKCVDQGTEIRGFNDPQKERYFKKRIIDKNLASKTITHLKSTRSLYIMCHIPIFCWISATFVEKSLKESGKVEMPRTLTEMYTHFLMIQTGIKHVKYTESKETDEEVIFKLGKLAFQQLEKGNLIFSEKDLEKCGIDITEASVYSGVCTQILSEESELCQGKVFSFVHLSIQEFLAALYVFLCFSNRQRNMHDQHQTSRLSALFRAATLHDLHKTAVNLALHHENGHLDLLLRFLLGLSLESNQNILKLLLPQNSSQSNSSEQTTQLVKQMIRDQGDDSDRRINLFFCLNELNHHAVVEKKSSPDTLHVHMLLPGQWKTKTFEFKMSKEQLAEFDLQKYIKTPEEDQTELLIPDEVLQKLLPVVTTSTSVKLHGCNLTNKSCSYLASALKTSHSSNLKAINLNKNELLDSGVELLCSALCHQNCKLEELQLQWCDLSDKSCSYLASALKSPSSNLTQLDLSLNPKIRASAIEPLCAQVKDPLCKLETLKWGYEEVVRAPDPEEVERAPDPEARRTCMIM